MPWWRNWYTRTLQERMSQDLGVQISPTAHNRISGCSIPVVHILREDADPVRFRAARQVL